MKKIFIILFFLSVGNLFAQLRSFNQIFPNIAAEARTAAFTQDGHVSYYQQAARDSLLGGTASGIPSQITNNILNKNPGYIIESINVFNCDSANLTMLDIYNAIGNVRGLRGRLYHSVTRGETIPLFEDATRIVSQSQTSAIPDPAPARTLPSSAETVYIRLKDANFGNTFYRGEVSIVQNGLSYSLTNFRAMTYFLISVIRAERFTAQLYIEPIREGILIYSIAGVDISDFAANRIDVN